MFEGCSTWKCIAATTRSLVKIATPHRLWHQPTRRAWCERKIFKPFCCLLLHIRAQTVQMSHLLILNVILPRTVSITYTSRQRLREVPGWQAPLSHVAWLPESRLCPAAWSSFEEVAVEQQNHQLPLGMHFRLARHVRDGLLSVRVAHNPCHQAHQHGSHQLRRRSP